MESVTQLDGRAQGIGEVALGETASGAAIGLIEAGAGEPVLDDGRPLLELEGVPSSGRRAGPSMGLAFVVAPGNRTRFGIDDGGKPIGRIVAIARGAGVDGAARRTGPLAYLRAPIEGVIGIARHLPFKVSVPAESHPQTNS